MKKYGMIRRAAVLAAWAGCLVGCSQPAVSWQTERMPAPSQMLTGDSISVSYPVARGGAAADSINDAIGRALSVLVGFGEDAVPGTTLSVRIDSMLAVRNYDTVIRHMPYELFVEGSVKEFGRVASVRIDSYVYLGGAHGLQTATFLNFDLRTGRELEMAELFSDTAELRRLNREAFMQARGADLADAVLFVAPDELPLPRNIAVDSAGVRMHYDPYEIAPYVFGPTDYLLPMDRVRPLLDPKFFRQPGQ